MKFLIIGASGTIGSKLIESLAKDAKDFDFTVNKNTAHYVNPKILDITNTSHTIDIIRQTNPDIVFHTAALTNLDLCESDHALANSININGTENIIEGCKITKSKLVFVSSSFVYDGTKQNYLEDEPISPITHYGITKGTGEKLVQNSGLNYLILRTDSLYGWIKKYQRINPVIRVIDTLKSGKVLREIIDWYNTPTYVPDFVHASLVLAENDEKGIFHVSGSDFLNRYDWSQQTADVFGLDRKLIIPIHSSELNLQAKRVNVNLINEKLFEKTGIHMKGIRDGLLAMKSNEPDNLF
jgi:dTDP-4-dehydrorhamnose reductase